MAYAGDLKSLAARIVGSSPTAPTIWLLRARVPWGCGLVSFGCRRGSNPRGGECQADAQRPQRAGEGAGRRPKPVRICAANTQTSHRPYRVLFTSPCSPGMRARFLWMPVDFRSCGGIVPVLTGYQPILELFHRNLDWYSHIFRWKNVVVSHIFRWKNVLVSHIFQRKRPNGLILAKRVGRQYAATAYE